LALLRRIGPESDVPLVIAPDSKSRRVALSEVRVASRPTQRKESSGSLDA